MSLNNREELNNYYQIVNDLVDEYTEKWKIRPSNLKRYLQPGTQRFNKFLERNKLNNDFGRLVLANVIEDRFNMEKDGVLTFESHKFLESKEYKIQNKKECLYKGIEKSTISMEKIIVDFFDTNLSDVDVIDSEKHFFSVRGWNDDVVEVLIFSSDDFKMIRDNLIEFYVSEANNSEITVCEDVRLTVSSISSVENLTKQVESVVDTVFCKKQIELMTSYSYKSFFRDHYIFVR